MRIALAILALALGACHGARRLSCDRPIQGLSAQPGDIVWFGEMHGTEESPRFVGDAACQIARNDSVQLGVEIPQDEQMRVHQYLMDGDRKALLAGPFWAQHDGRSSHAMIALFDRIRDWRTRGGRIEVVAFDITNEPDRDKAMARAVAAARNPNGVFVALSGNIHSRRTKWNDMTPLVAHLVADKLPVRSYDVSSSGGTMWACMSTPDHEPTCGEHPNSDDGGKSPPWSIGKPRDDSHDGVYFVGKTKASFPARR